ncbi:MAG: glycosyltransferase family 87 protein [Vicinamibacterales bacterium]
MIGSWIRQDRWRELSERVGVLATAGVFVTLLGVAVSLDYPRTARGFKGDEATYYSLTHSLARDFDFTFQRQDLVRVWEEFPGPEGIFLKRGSKIDFQRQAGFPFVRIVRTEDPARYRLYYAKSYIYPLFAAPFVRVFGTNGFLIFHAVLLTFAYAVAYRFLTARGARPGVAASFTGIFMFGSVVPVYFVWLMPEIFNFTIVFCAYFLWTYKLVAPPVPSPKRFEQFLRSPRSDTVAAVLLGVATFSKPTHVILIGPLLAWLLWRRELRRFLAAGLSFALVVLALFAINAAITGDFNYQGGIRKTFYSRTGFPFANTWETFDNRGQSMTTDAVPFDILFHRDTATVLLWNLGYFVVGRYNGLLPYFFPGIVAAGLFLGAGRERRTWQWLVAGALVAGALGLIAYMPYTYSGGGAPIGNRYYLSYYPLFLFLLPPLRGIRAVLTALAIGALFTAKLVLNPFYTSSNPGEHAKAGPLRLLPIERTLLNDLAVSADPDRSRRPLAGTPPVTAYFVDDGAYPPEGEIFWLRGKSRADVLLRAPTTPGADGNPLPLRVRSWSLEVTNGSSPNHVTVRSGWRRASIALAPGEVRTIEIGAGAGVPYKPARFPTNYVYALSLDTSDGFVPFLTDTTSTDSRYLGAMVRLTPIYFNP